MYATEVSHPDPGSIFLNPKMVKRILKSLFFFGMSIYFSGISNFRLHVNSEHRVRFKLHKDPFRNFRPHGSEAPCPPFALAARRANLRALCRLTHKLLLLLSHCTKA